MKGLLIVALGYIEATRRNMSHARQMLGVFVLCLFLGGVAFAQKAAPPVPTPADDNIACSNKVQPTTGFTECEMLRLSNYMGQMSQIRSDSEKQIAPVAAQGNEFVAKVVSLERNKGKQYESPSQQFPLGRLVPIPAPKPPTDPHTGQPAGTAPATAPAAAPAPAPAKQ